MAEGRLSEASFDFFRKLVRLRWTLIFCLKCRPPVVYLLFISLNKTYVMCLPLQTWIKSTTMCEPVIYEIDNLLKGMKKVLRKYTSSYIKNMNSRVGGSNLIRSYLFMVSFCKLSNPSKAPLGICLILQYFSFNSCKLGRSPRCFWLKIDS